MKTRNIFKKSATTRNFLALLTVGLLTLSCSDDDDNPIAVDEEEVITTMTISLTEGSNTVTLETRDLDGDGPDDPVITVENLAANTTYTGAIVLLNETESPVENKTSEIAEEDDEHQFFFDVSGAVTSVVYNDADGNGNPLGLSFTLTTGDAGTGTLRVTLRHEPKKPNDGSLADAGGETDIAQSFTVVVE
jgi:hypothetical protein